MCGMRLTGGAYLPRVISYTVSWWRKFTSGFQAVEVFALELHFAVWLLCGCTLLGDVLRPCGCHSRVSSSTVLAMLCRRCESARHPNDSAQGGSSSFRLL